MNEIKAGQIVVVQIGNYIKERYRVIDAKPDKTYFLGRLVKKNGEFDKRGDPRVILSEKIW